MICFLKNKEEIDTLARTIYGEARGESFEGLKAVANVIINRVDKPCWWGDDIVSVCKKKYQFSCWNANDPNKEKLEKITAKDKRFKDCLRIARDVIAGSIEDNTNGATHYHTKSIMPYWVKDNKPCADIDNHLFYKGI